MSQIIWISERQARAIHQQQIALFGGASGILDAGKLSSALARPKHIYNYNPNANLSLERKTLSFTEGCKRILQLIQAFCKYVV